jgi:PAS domain S-box-containing protein
VESSDDAIIGESLDGTLTSWNAGATHLFGYRAEEVIGKHISLFAPPERGGEGLQLLERVSQRLTVARFETVRVHKDGTPIDVSLTISPIQGEAGRVIGASIIARDIRRLMQAQRAAERAREAAEELARVREERAREAEAMVVVGAALAGTLDLPTLYQVILDQSAKLLPGDYASVLAIEDGWLIAAATRGEPARPPGLRIWPVDRAPTGWRERRFHEPTIVADTVQEPTWPELPPWVGEHRVRSLLTTPIRIEGAVRGFFAVYSRSPSAFTADHARLAGLFAEHAGQALSNARLHAAAQAARVRAEYESNLLQTLMDAIPDAIYFKDAQARFIRINQAEADLLGVRDPQETVGKSNADYFSGELAQALVLKDRQILETGQPLINDLEDQSVPAGAPRWILTTKVPIVREGQITGLVGISRDITDLRAAVASRVQAETANQAKSAFLSRMSHELRTPLNAILGFGQLLELDSLDVDQRKSVAHILKAGRHLLTLINEVLEISRIEAGRLELSLEPVAVTEVVDEACGLLLPLIRERAIRVERPAGDHRACYVQADRQRFGQVLMNLLSNAVKYNVTGGTVQIICSHPGPGRLRLSVQDTGPGIPVEKQGRLFTPFDRLGAEQTGVEGTGMGLALSKGLVEAMGGTLGVQSAAGEGSAFWVELERADPAPRACAEPACGVQGEAEQAPAQRTILYIEDNLASLELIEGVLAREPGITLLTAMQGSRGLDLARAQRPDLVLLDVHLPDMPGDEVLRRLQADAATRHIPVMVISADATHHQEERLTAAGARAYLTKPIDIRQLRATLASLVPPEAVLRPDSVNEHG